MANKWGNDGNSDRLIPWRPKSLQMVTVLQEGGPLPRPKSRLLSNTQKWIVWEDTCGDKVRDFIGKEDQGGEQQGEGTQENSSATWLTVSGFMVMGLASGLSSTNHSDSESCLVLHALFSQDGCQWEGFWEVVGHVVFHFDLSQTLPVGGGLFVPCSLPGPPVIKQFMHMVTRVSGQGGRFQSVCFPWQLQPRNKKTLAPWKKSYDKPREHIKKQRHYFANKGLYSQRYVVVFFF